MSREFIITCVNEKDADQIEREYPNSGLVRCKDCKHWCTDSTPCMEVAGVHFCAMVDFYSTADWFCAYGERREDDAKEST